MALESKQKQLPEELSERARWLNEHDVGDGPVVYWFHRCLRLEENPALDAALHLAAALNRPLALVAELSTERDPYASMRHWTFELEGLLELRAQLSEHDIPLDIYVESDGHPGSRYREIVERAGLLVTEDLPVASERAFRAKLVDVVQVPFLVVDASCVIPMNHTKKPIRRAFAFRDRYKDIIEAACRSTEPPGRVWPSITFSSLALDGVLNEEIDVAKALSFAPIDHSVAPVSDTRGGRRAALKRWHAFVESQGLRRYAKRRNDALGDGVSRMSAYLHYGFVAPFELARWGHSSEKYIDELIVWRELAWHYCKAVPTHHSVDCLPEWATKSLTRYGQDKPAGPQWQQLWDGETDDPFWNSCQQSLRELGELHNNTRMTWGKALVEWAASPEQALTWLTELNHRLALDGNDPASYGGLLWCLGEFDRPFKPAKPIWGEVRDRSTEIHAQRCPPEALSAWVESRNGYHGLRVGIVGAGVTALAAALSLRAHGVQVTLWDKGYNPGGRVARRPTAGEGGIEHGTQSFLRRGTSLQHQRFLEHCRAWSGSTHLQEFDDSPNGFHGDGNLQGWLRELIRPFAFHRQTAVSRIALKATDIEVLGPEESLGTFDAVIATVPAPQMAPLVSVDLAGGPSTSR